MASDNNSEIGRKWAKEIARVGPNKFVAKHRRHGLKTPPGREVLNPGIPAAMREEVHKKTVEARIYHIVDECETLSKLAKEKAETSRDFQAAASCFDPAIRALGLVAKSDNQTDQNKGVSAIITFMENERSKEHQ